MRSRRKQGSTEAALDAALIACARKGLQLTELRRDVLRLILQSAGPSTAYQLLSRLREQRPNATPPTVYRVLDFLVAQQLVHKVERLNAFVPCTEAHHHHDVPAQFLICSKCGNVAEIEDRAVSDALERAAELKGFHPETTVVELAGTCAQCFRPAQ
ncbi:MAG: transcriptional repressor [Acetobacteraceae bacterium]|nr:transcriptional repressor [Acetobacteraceae bacterium]